ncbi:FAD-dependent oxidoreductase [uncultured Draconibacterium sp.]|uniref:FAD-dependent oxidoreductase n=1 Tax=uncultured Draconibacterium sp. TaxID=1573823 RepID=UPI002AA7789C|nr:FAD-dependent oxidoreductase [uncultured Draconibacterium sp.]
MFRIKIGTALLVLAGIFAGQPGYAGSNKTKTDVLIIGGGASGTMAGIQAARQGVSVLIAEETVWLGGMLTSAGVSAIDGNYRLPSGLWEEFRQALYGHYGGPEGVKTGWVSNVLFEPQVAERILTEFTRKEKNLTVKRETFLADIRKNSNGWIAILVQHGDSTLVHAKVVIDATELGDVAKQVGIPYDIGMDSHYDTGEDIAPEKANNIIQDLTYVAILKEYDNEEEAASERPEGYNPEPFYCTCAGKCEGDVLGRKLWDCEFMMKYGKLPNGYYMINWPISGNDYYVNGIEMSREEREKAYEKAKNFTLQYVYYLQNELGFKNLGIANDVYPTADNLPFFPYHRESRRIKGVVRFTVNDLAHPFEQKTALYRTGIAVGDYPVDHHHQTYHDAQSLPELHFYPVPSYSLPLGTLIPKETADFIVSEKSLSVTNIVNGTTRLQPVCILNGQAAGALAALSVKNMVTPEKVAVREVQKALLQANAMLMPYSDVPKTHPAYEALQRIGATGLMHGEGKNIGWENHTLMSPDSVLTPQAVKEGLADWLPVSDVQLSVETVSLQEALEVIRKLGVKYKQPCGKQSLKKLEQKSRNLLAQKTMGERQLTETITRAEYAVLLDELLNPFEARTVTHNGHFTTKE